VFVTLRGLLFVQSYDMNTKFKKIEVLDFEKAFGFE
jgi:hypothetical protein